MANKVRLLGKKEQSNELYQSIAASGENSTLVNRSKVGNRRSGVKKDYPPEKGTVATASCSEGKGTAAIASCLGPKLITDVIYVPDIDQNSDIDQNLLSVGKFIEKGFKVIFMEKKCVIEDVTGQKMFEIKMAERIFSLNPMQKEQSAFLTKESISMVWHKRLGHYHY
ncbi:Retrovirus-related Pol polyprotein from transposon TNT 1-94 [Gossypium australe]|uniref:Retrovirus-related Pol polyprotein from transposon TNT 1-94 n=1 Tax=Gossypium australe TaxID=47621 RepID=A0A5B6UUV2_9ROSI|nr:Retrovirus-related Pol polyprotein from transposon TNT 1-94 [Gossypium australe]